MSTKRNIRIGMGQLLVEGGEPERNLARAEELAREASAAKCDILLLPECMDLAWTHPSAKVEAQPIPGTYSDLLAQFAKDYNLYICGGLTEKSPSGRVYNTAVFIDNKGNLLHTYRKINILKVEKEFYQAGQSLSTLETPFGIVGVNICADNYVDGLSIGHTLARMGAELILSPSSWTVDYSVSENSDPYGQKWIRPYRHLASLYNLAIVGTTSVGVIVGGPYEGKKSVGCSLAVDKSGVIASGSFNEFASQLILADLTVPVRDERGTEISDRLRAQGYDFEAGL
ncbi:MAG: carbon-nitrogen hydrolase family protein [Bdellovibrionota bacterium]